MAGWDAKDAKAAKSALEGSWFDASYRLAERLTDEVTARLPPGAGRANAQVLALLNDYLQDTAEFIFKTYRNQGKVSTSDVKKYMLKKHKNLFKAVGLDHAACGLAVAQLIVTLSTAAPAMAAEINAAIVVTGIGFATGGLGVPFAAGSWVLVGLSLLGLYLSATQTAQVCSQTMSSVADRYGQSQLHGLSPSRPRPYGYTGLRCEITVERYPTHVFDILNGALGRMTLSPLR